MGAERVRRFLKGAAANAVYYGGARRAVNAIRRQQAGGRRVLIVGYHRVVEDFERASLDAIPGTLISRRTFRRQLEDAHAAGYAFARLSDAADVLAGKRTVRQDLVVVTFDDGYRDVFSHAFPVLQEMGIPAVVYVPSGYLGTSRRFDHDRLFHLLRICRERRTRLRDDAPPEGASLWNGVAGGRPISAALDEFLGQHSAATLGRVILAFEQEVGVGPALRPESGELMGWDEARTMARAGVDFGAHTVDHRVLTLEPLDVVEREIRDSKARIQAELGTGVDSFAYCNGWYSDDVINLLVKHGFRTAVTTEDALNRIGGDPFALKRKVLWENFSVGAAGRYSTPLTTCHLDDLFGLFNVNHQVPGRRPRAEGSSTVEP
jgi:peptidoglycan/xylan/chitin deacetylase (PgdA/CDA1 family)